MLLDEVYSQVSSSEPPRKSEPVSPLRSVNFHIVPRCNLRCDFCFATFRDVRGRLETEDAIRIIRLLAEAGTEKLNFAGGEPTLHPQLPELIEEAKRLGMTTSVISNGFRLLDVIKRAGGSLDWAALSVDSASEATQKELGRGKGNHVAQALAVARASADAGCRLKLNTVVTALNWSEDMSAFVRAFKPERWKVFQVLRVEGQNDGRVEPLLIEPEQFQAFLDRHRHLAGEGIAPVPESNDAMTDSYAMIDPLGRFYGDHGGVHEVSRPVLEVGVMRALQDIHFDPRKLEARGGIYTWER